MVLSRGLTTIRAMLDDTNGAEVPGAGFEADDAEVSGARFEANGAEVPGAGFEADGGGADPGVDDQEELIAVQRVRFARLLKKLEGEGFDGSKHQAKLEATGTWPAADEGDRRDFLLDSSAVRLLAADRELLAVYLRLLQRQPGVLLIPMVAMGEAYSCGPDGRALVDRLIEEISVDGDVFVHLTLETARRAGELQFEMLAAEEASEEPDDTSGPTL
jgi:hypothetical protein